MQISYEGNDFKAVVHIMSTNIMVWAVPQQLITCSQTQSTQLSSKLSKSWGKQLSHTAVAAAT